MLMPQPVFRFAPSPTGRLHLGHVRSAVITHRLARRAGGRALLRIEDTDRTRCRAEFTAVIIEDLAWLGLEWDGPVRHQSEHLADYDTYVRQLEHDGLLYPCFATRSEIAAAAALVPRDVDPDGAPLYPGLHRGLAVAEVEARKRAGHPYAMRLDMARAIATARIKHAVTEFAFTAFDENDVEWQVLARPGDWGDPVLVRKETGISYHLAVVVDDMLQGVSHVTRGMDLLRATDLHRLLQVLLDFPAPRYHHHALLLDVAGRKLSKRDGDLSLAKLREEGATREDVFRLAGV